MMLTEMERLAFILRKVEIVEQLCASEPKVSSARVCSAVLSEMAAIKRALLDRE